jgi:predicted nucleotidyltransferase
MPLPLDELRLLLARQGAQVLYAHGAAHVWLFGSLASGRVQDRRSDIDLAVDGMSGREADAVTPAVERVIGCHVDVLSFDEELPIQLRAQALRSRVLLPRGEDGGELRAPSRWYGGPGRARQLFLQRLDRVVAELEQTDARSVIDLGCGSGWLIELLAKDPRYVRLAGADLSEESLTAAQNRLSTTLTARELAQVQLFISVLTWSDPRLRSWDAATVIEVIEHLDQPRREAFEHVLFHFARPRTILVTTPNAEYNVKFRFDEGERFRHRGHHFEWTRAQFGEWAEARAGAAGYIVRLSGIGPADPVVGTPTQMAIFSSRP